LSLPPGCFRKPHTGAGIIEYMLITEYDGCGRCLVAVRRLSRKTDKTSSPQRQGDQDLQAAVDADGHIIAWADDWEVSGATDPMTRKGLPVAARRDGAV
jgi:hypothetical protein